MADPITKSHKQTDKAEERSTLYDALKRYRQRWRGYERLRSDKPGAAEYPAQRSVRRDYRV